jgi:outer membrane protein OmpA-like peptidoglycan-associated protein
MNYKRFGMTLLLGAGLAAPYANAQADDPPAGNAPANKTQPADDSASDATMIPSVDLLFDTDSAVLTSDARQELRRLATWAKCTGKGALILEGHADIRGTSKHNLKLSAQRVAAVRAQLVKMGVPTDRLVVTVYGEHGPKRPTLAENRRVTVRATAKPIPASDIPSPQS